MLLTISIPTYNRAKNLDFLLGVLEKQLRGLEDKVAVYVSDNASTDDTPSVVARYSQRMPNLSIRRNEENLGPDWNIHQAYATPRSRYVWILGDDDAPILGGIAQIIDALDRFKPDMLYVPAVGRPDIAAEYLRYKVKSGRPLVQLSRKNFAAAVNAMFTFISAFILKKDVVAPEVLQKALKITDGTKLIQLAWIYETLNHGTRFVHMRGPLLLSTNGANSGYGILDVLMVNQARLVERLLHRHPDVQKAILFRANLSFFPWLIWYMRKDRLGTFDIQAKSSIVVPEILFSMFSFKYIVVPIWVFPERLAEIFYHASRVLSRLSREYDRIITFR